MHNIKEILNKNQLELLPFLKSFSKNFGLVGGTAIALHLGHRQSIDFDLFSVKEFNNTDIRKIILKNNKKIKHIFQDSSEEYTVLVYNVKITFLYYPFKIKFSEKVDSIIKMPDLLTLAAMKAYTLSRRAKWKDYVDLYFILKNHYNINKIVKKANQIFADEFNEKIFRSALSYFKDIDYTEQVIYIDGLKVSDSVIKKELKEFSLN